MILPRKLKIWLALAVIPCGLVLAFYTMVQQNYRTSANDPQIQMAHDTADQLNSGISPRTITSGATAISIGQSLAPFTEIFDDAHHLVSSTGTLGGSVPTPPSGVFEFTRAHGEDRLTWQPRPDIREATVVVHAKSGYVLTARSLREVEMREDALTGMAVLTLAAVLLASFVLIIILK